MLAESAFAKVAGANTYEYMRGTYMKKLSTMAVVAFVSLAAATANVHAEQKGMSGMEGQKGMSGMSGMQGQKGMSGMEGQKGMSGMGGMSGMEGQKGMSGMQGKK